MKEAVPTQNRLVEECQGLVRYLAKQVRSRTPSWVETDDLIAYGQVGLLQAARDFDPNVGTKFSTFAYYRIRGAIFDGINKLMWCRTTRDPEYKYEQTADSLAQSISSGGMVQENVSEEANWFSRTASALAVSYLVSSDGVGRTADVVDKAARPPWSQMVQAETHLQLIRSIDRLPPEAAALVRMVYYEDRTLQEAANQLKISRSWASRLHARALEQMARYLKQANFSDSTDDGQGDD